ncbi:MAG: Asp-tRNA(Asn)/Glu-tRNA(Gln) amidotransferase subunit GatA, partial [Holosporaceae bacterium]|nr:Asp-tRNA(Asn)/Glu-tRNA(Gln) amidotransferase subunit GatA [Holosporaceae bacterium]
MYNLSLYDIRKGLVNKEFSSVELTKCFLNRMEQFSNLNAFITVCADQALKSAQKSDQKIARGQV